MKVTMKWLALLSLITSVMACTQEKPFKEVSNKKLDLDKGSVEADIIVNDEIVASGKDHLLMVSNVGGDMNSPAIAYEIGDPMKVRIVMDKEGALSIYKIPNYKSDNLQNRKLVVSIPIENIDYKCAEDDFGKCTNSEIIDTDKEWYEKSYFKPKFENVETKAIVGLSHQYFNFSRNCFSETDSKLVDYKIEEGALNFTVENNYKTNASCLDAIDAREYTDLNFSTRIHYSVVDLDLLKTPDYKKQQVLTFPSNDGQVEFGFFQTIIDGLDSSNRRIEGDEETLINRWDPNKEVITYYLSKPFQKKENASIKEATEHAVGVINHSLKKAGAKIQIQLKNANDSIIEGDVRNNFIFMVEDPISRGLLGYGPSVTNPDTGEILSARTVMYKGIMKQTIRNAYNELVEQEIKNKQAEKNKEIIAEMRAKGKASKEQGEVTGHASSSLLNVNKNAIFQNVALKEKSSAFKKMVFNNIEKPVDLNKLKNRLDSNPNRYDRLSILKQANMSMEDLQTETEYLIQKNFYPSNLAHFHEEVEDKLKGLIATYGLTSWNYLPEAAKENIINTLLPVLWVPTLVHEMGHNLGLRHNFSGSNDKKNFYSKDELEEMNIHKEITYSSIMDYAFNTTNELPVMGSYDIGALRFAYGFTKQTKVINGKEQVIEYNGTVEMVNSNEPKASLIVSFNNSEQVNEALSQGYTFKNFEFCTDEHVGLNANCNRFDEGTNLVEIANHYIQNYENIYTRLNLKNGRESFDNISGSISYILYVEAMFRNLRLNFERYEDIKNLPNLGLDSEQWKTNEFLVDLKNATILSGQFFLDVLKTPNALCRISSLDDPENMLGLYPLAGFGPYYSHCGQLELNPGYVVTGQAGKSFNDLRWYKNPNNYIGQIDTRGIWADKLLAAKYLFSRKMTFLTNDKFYENFLSVPELQDSIVNTLHVLMQDQIQANVTVKTDPVFNTDPRLSLGEDLIVPWSYNLNQENSHLINRHLHSGVRNYFLLGEEPVTLQQQLVQVVKHYNESQLFADQNYFIENLLSLKANAPENSIVADPFVKHYNRCFAPLAQTQCVSEFDGSHDKKEGTTATQLADVVYLAKPSNAVGIMAMTYAETLPKATALLAEYNTVPNDIIEKGESEVAQWQQQRQERLVLLVRSALGAGDPPAELSSLESEILSIDGNILLGLFTGDINGVDYYENLISTLAEAI